MTGRRKKTIALTLVFAFFSGAGYFLTRTNAVPEKPAAQATHHAHKKNRTPSGKVSKLVEKNRAHAKKEIDTFLNDGWKSASANPPDNQRILSEPNPLTPEALNELHTTLQTVLFEAGDMDLLMNIARKTQDAKTQYLAIDAISRMPMPEVEEHLAALFDELDSHDSRSQILATIEPSSPRSAGTRFLTSLLSRPDLRDDLKEQALYSLVGLAITDAAGAKEIQTALPGEWSEKLALAVKKIGARR